MWDWAEFTKATAIQKFYLLVRKPTSSTLLLPRLELSKGVYFVNAVNTIGNFTDIVLPHLVPSKETSGSGINRGF